ncbi:MAG: hypothetical protein R3B90_10750 [Planctomycetaceae bacterium]
MTLKRRLVYTGLCFVLIVGIGVALVATWGMSGGTNQIRNGRAQAIGLVTGLLVAIGWAALWLPVAAALGKQRRAERARNAKPNRKVG